MRIYPTDSPEAAARMISLAMMADGTIDRSETLLLERQQMVSRLGLSNEQFDSIYYDYCTDMLSSAFRLDSGQLELNEHKVKRILSEITDTGLQKKVLRMMLDIVNADHRLTAGEAALIALVLKHWDIDLCEMSESSIPRHVISPVKQSNPCLSGTSPSGGFNHVAA